MGSSLDVPPEVIALLSVSNCAITLNRSGSKSGTEYSRWAESTLFLRTVPRPAGVIATILSSGFKGAPADPDAPESASGTLGTHEPNDSVSTTGAALGGGPASF